ncbi:MAG: DUF6572 domain-containing protein [Ignavibacteriota bacterium]
MAVDDPGVVDIMSESETGSIVLTISDHMDWQDSLHHQRTLQEKINRYLAFVESGEILQHRPDAAGKPITIRVVCKYEADAKGRGFLRRVKAAVDNAGFEFRYEFFGH